MTTPAVRSGHSSLRDFALNPPQRAAWLQEWWSNKPDFVMLHCGHKEDVKQNGTTVLLVRADRAKRRVTVYCEQCETFSPITRHLSLREWCGLPPVRTPTDPPY